MQFDSMNIRNEGSSLRRGLRYCLCIAPVVISLVWAPSSWSNASDSLLGASPFIDKTTQSERLKELEASVSAQSPTPSSDKKKADSDSTDSGGKTSSELSNLLSTATTSEQAFSRATSGMMPMTPLQVKTLRYLYNKNMRAAAAGDQIDAPRPETTSINVRLSPGSVPPIIRLSTGIVSSLIFLDSTSSPWPIEWYDIGDPDRFDVKYSRAGSSNTLMIQALNSYRSANIAIKLRGLSTPVMLTLLPGQKRVDYRVDLRVPGLGPKANAASKKQADGVNGGALSDKTILQVLNGIPPKKNTPMLVTGGPADAWLIGNKLYLRTRLSIMSPGWISHIASADGTHAYELPNTPIVLAYDHGQTVSLQIQELKGGANG